MMSGNPRRQPRLVRTRPKPWRPRQPGARLVGLARGVRQAVSERQAAADKCCSQAEEAPPQTSNICSIPPDESRPLAQTPEAERIHDLLEKTRRQESVIIAIGAGNLAQIVARPDELIAFAYDDPEGASSRPR